MKEMNMFEEKGFSCNTVSTKLGTKDGLVQRYDGLLHYQGELGDFWYDPREFELIEIFDKECLHYAGESALVHFPKGCISTRYMFYRSELPEGFKLVDFDTSEVVDMQGMFLDCKASVGFSLGENFDTGNVLDMRRMFENGKMAYDFNLGDKFCITHDTDYRWIFENCTPTSDTFLKNLLLNKKKVFKQKTKKHKESVQDVESLSFATKVILATSDGHEYPAVVFGDKFGFANGSYMQLKAAKEANMKVFLA